MVSGIIYKIVDLSGGRLYDNTYARQKPHTAPRRMQAAWAATKKHADIRYQEGTGNRSSLIFLVPFYLRGQRAKVCVCTRPWRLPR